MSLRIKILLGFVAVILLLGATYYLRVVRPWMVSPDASRAQVEAQWRELQRLASPELREHGDRARLDGAAQALQPAMREVETFLRGRESGAPLDPGAVPAALTHVADLLVEWHRQGGGLGTGDAATQMRHGAEARRVGRATLAIAAPGDDRLEAVLHLAQALRREGGLANLGYGLALVESALRLHPGPLPARYAPTDREVLAGLAVEVLNLEHLAQEQPVQGWDSMARHRELPFGVWINPDREIQMLKWVYGSRFHAAAASTDPLGELLGQFAEEGRLPRSVLVLTTLPTFDRLIPRARQIIRQYQARVAPAAP